ncbi:MAG: undecaprenyldiphospho-muramoylpentapeptide beta-N-acetylglucosaminyltransferase [Bdellovibrionales bacterium]|nr:undecaprenyldiphospho-muramoylpentapeptide beta-N-acetylglucosaminyltransferase [Bdellovibrionales bacterium]
MSKSNRLLVAGGGTGGHILAGIAVADEWIKQFEGQAQVLFVGAENGLETRLVPKYGYPLKVLRIGALNRVSLKTRATTMFLLPFSFLKALWIIVSFRPHAVLGVGGYASGPMVLLAHVCSTAFGYRTAILEQNSVAGFTNRMLGRFVHRVFCAFDDGKKSFNVAKVKVTGNPIRSSLKRLPASPIEPFTLFIFGGSQGALGINTMILDALPFLKDQGVHFIHQTGVKDFERVEQGYARAGVQGRIEKFIDDMGSCYAQASLVVCRSGASSLSELASVGRAAIFIPLPTAADNHQEVNARIYERAGASLVVPQGSMDGRAFADLILGFKKDPSRIRSIEEKITAFYRSDSAQAMVQDLRK